MKTESEVYDKLLQLEKVYDLACKEYNKAPYDFNLVVINRLDSQISILLWMLEMES